MGGPRSRDEHALDDVVGPGYRIVGVVGRGGIATTYLAVDPNGARVALKQLFLWRRHDWKLFEREATVLSRLAQPGIPRLSL